MFHNLYVVPYYMNRTACTCIHLEVVLSRESLVADGAPELLVPGAARRALALQRLRVFSGVVLPHLPSQLPLGAQDRLCCDVDLEGRPPFGVLRRSEEERCSKCYFRLRSLSLCALLGYHKHITIIHTVGSRNCHLG